MGGGLEARNKGRAVEAEGQGRCGPLEREAAQVPICECERSLSQVLHQDCWVLNSNCSPEGGSQKPGGMGNISGTLIHCVRRDQKYEIFLKMERKIR